MQAGDYVYSDRPPRRVQRLESAATDPLINYSDSSEEASTEASSKLLPLTTSTYAVTSAACSTLTGDRDRVAVLRIFDRAAKLSKAPDSTECTVYLQTTASQSKPSTQGSKDENSSTLPHLSNLDPA